MAELEFFDLLLTHAENKTLDEFWEELAKDN